MLATNETGQVALLLFFGAVAVDLVYTEIGVRAIRKTHRRAGAGDLFHGHHMSKVTHIGAAIFFADGDTQYAQVAEFAPQIHGELVASVYFPRVGGDFSLGEVAHG